MTASQRGLTLPFVNLLKDKNIDWEGNCIFENGKVVGFKTKKASNHYHMRPIPTRGKALGEARDASKILDIMMYPATPDQVAIVFKKLSLHCGKQKKTDEENRFLFMDYYADLKKYPATLIEEACEKYRRLPEGNEFMPSSGKLISLIAEKYHKMKFLRTRIDKILGTYVEPKKKKNQTVSLSEALEKLTS